VRRHFAGSSRRTDGVGRRFAAARGDERLRMDKSVARLNIEHYRKLLATDLDATKRQTILQLLAREEATLARLNKGDQADGD
jgi:hypothetical protein